MSFVIMIGTEKDNTVYWDYVRTFTEGDGGTLIECTASPREAKKYQELYPAQMDKIKYFSKKKYCVIKKLNFI